MDMDITEIPVESIKDILSEYRVIKKQNSDNYSDKSASEFLEDKLVDYTNICIKIEKEYIEKHNIEYNKLKYSEDIKTHEDKKNIVDAKLIKYSNKINDIKTLINFISFKLSRFG